VRHTTVVVVGGGITGLSCAYTLARNSVDFLLVEKQSKLGGTIRTERTDGFILDAGPDAFLAQKPDAVALCRELGLGESLIPTNPEHRTVFVYDGDRLHPLPEGMVLTVPTRVLPLATSSLFSPLGKLRMALELVIPARRDGQDESIASFIERRLGREALERLAEPLLAGIHSGEPERLSMGELFPRFVNLEKKYRSLVWGMRKVAPRRKDGPPASLFLSLTNGLSELVERLAAKLPTGSVLLEDGVEEIRREANRYRLKLSSGEEISAAACVLALPLRDGERLSRELSPELATAIAAIPSVSTAVVFLALGRQEVQNPLAGYGFVVPRTAQRRILAATFVSTKFPNRAPDSRVLLRAFLGGARDPEVLKLPDQALVELVHRELAEILGPLGTPAFSRVYRWRDATPQIEVGHATRLAAIEGCLAELPGLQVAGNGLRGVGIPDCIADGRGTAERLVQYLANGSEGKRS
jgi:oxygen-dependent protoporphyrinogen oxidase